MSTTCPAVVMDPAGLWPQQGTRRERLPARITRTNLKPPNARRKAPSKPASPASNTTSSAAKINHQKKHTQVCCWCPVGLNNSFERRTSLELTFRVALQIATQLYLDVANGLHPTHQPARSRLFSQTSNASTAALRSKLCPSLTTTNDWTRLQRKLLPKYMFVLDAVTAVQLLQCLARLQPPVVQAAHYSSIWQDTVTSAAAVQVKQHAGIPALHDGHQPVTVEGDEHPAWQQHRLKVARQHINRLQIQPATCPSLDLLASLRTSNYVSLAGPVPGCWPAAPANSTQLAAAQAYAITKGFPDVATARQEFDLMLTAVYTVLGPKVARWPFSVQLQLLRSAGHLQLCHQTFLQVRTAECVEPQWKTIHQCVANTSVVRLH